MLNLSLPAGRNINSTNLEQNLGKSLHHVAGIDAEVARQSELLQGESLGYLTGAVGDACLSLERRLAAGAMLAVMRDIRINRSRPLMLPVDGGLLMAGSSQTEIDMCYAKYQGVGVLKEWLQKEYPRHAVKVNSFYVAKYLITNGEYHDYLIKNPQEKCPTAWAYGRYPRELSNHPVFGISAQSAECYAKWLSAKSGIKYRLLTEYEWEWAALGDSQNEFPWGSEFSDRRTNTLELGLLGTSPVGAFATGASWCGAQDMAGNVEEFVSTKYFSYPGGAEIQDDLWKSDSYVMTRGGSFTRHSDLARCKRRHGYFDGPLYPTGFRLAASSLLT